MIFPKSAYVYMVVSKNGGTPHSWMVYKGKSHVEMDDDWGYPYFRKPPYIHVNLAPGVKVRQ